MNWNKKILVTGGSGFLGSFLVEELIKRGAKNILAPSSQKCDLRNKSDCKKILKDIDIVFHLAGTSGGIGFLEEKPADVFYDNIMMGTNLIHEAKEAGVEKLITLGTICSYPKFAPIPFTEENLWDGYPDETNATYGLAKKMLLVQSQAYRQQYDFKSIVLFPTNLYGPRDNFDPKYANVIPSLINKTFQAKKSNDTTVMLWGDGSPTRDFLYVQDAVRGLILAAEIYDDDLPVNLSSDEEVSIKDLASLISELMEFKGDIKWDASKPNGQVRRKVSNKRAEEKFGFKPEVSLKEGLRRTIDWYCLNHPV
ncbi:MAG: GDP-L-fucose synthase [Nitrosopumilaceae archaeon]